MIPFEEFYWTLKSLFPGDSEFTFERYPGLPYEYVINSISAGMKEHRKRLHEMERPIALGTSVLANLHRDVKNRKTPYDISDFSVYASKDDLDLPAGSYGAAALKLVKGGRMPSWALFCFKELTANARKNYVPTIAAFVCEDAMLLHPKLTPGGWKGMLIAMESASDSTRIMYDDTGAPISLLVPEIPTKVVAVEDVVLSLSANQAEWS